MPCASALLDRLNGLLHFTVFHDDHHAEFGQFGVHDSADLDSLLASAPEHIPFGEAGNSGVIERLGYQVFALRTNDCADHLHSVHLPSNWLSAGTMSTRALASGSR